VEAGGLERLAELIVQAAGLRRVAGGLDEAIDGVHPKTDGLHVKGRDRAP
jgi:hypothetical protein